MTQSQDDAAVDGLRALIERRGVKITTLAEQTGVPYRSMQNYIYKKSKMPLAVYVSICQYLEITADYIFDHKFKLRHHSLQEAIINVLGPLLPRISLDADLQPTLLEKPSGDAADVRRTASLIALMVASEYDRDRERVLIGP